MLNLPASAIPWTLGPARGAPDAQGYRRAWTQDDADRLAHKGVILTAGGYITVGALRT